MSTMAISGGGLSAQLMYALNDISREMRNDLRERAEHESQQALREGLAEAHELHEKADDQLKGAIVGGIVTSAGAAIQMGAAAGMEIKGKGMVEVDRGASLEVQRAQIDSNELARATVAHTNQRMGAIASSGGTLGSMGKIAQDIYGAKASAHEANAREHAARSQAATRAADVARSAEQEAKQTADKARDTHVQVMSLEHAGTMAVLRG